MKIQSSFLKVFCVLLLIIGLCQGKSYISRCEAAEEKVILPLLRNLESNYTQNHLDVFYNEAVVLSLALPKYGEICKQVNFPSLDEDLLGELKVDCQSALEEIYLMAKSDSGKKILAEQNTFIPLLGQFTLQCPPYKFKGQFKPQVKDSNKQKGMKCAVCTFLLQMIEQYVQFHKVSISELVAEKIICKNLTQPLKTTCELSVEVIGPQIIDAGVEQFNADVICNKLKQCVGFEQCTIHPQKKKQPNFLQEYSEFLDEVTPWDWIIDQIKRFADNHTPLFDLDNDTFSDFPTLRGYDWRGYDCDDTNPLIYPGRKDLPEGVQNGKDYNCNGIYGIDPETNKTYKELYCDGQDYQGTLLMGDSAGAHFSIPAEWVDATRWQKGTFKGFFYRLSNELDLPHKSAGTGWVHEPYVDSGYLQNIKKNRCVRGDYQNTGVNGARSGAELRNIKYALKRDQKLDYPATVQFELVGNDVCNGHPGFEHMTTPEQFRTNILNIWNYLDTMLPAGSRMMVTGLANGSILYDTLQNKMNPFGVPYPVFYDFLNCLEISPCWGWMNSDKAARDGTTARAMQLNKVYLELIEQYKFKNFEIIYLDIPMDEVFKRANEMGFTDQDCIEPVDGFHPSQLTNYILTQIDAEKITALRPSWILKENPNNKLIDQKFPHMKPYPDL